MDIFVLFAFLLFTGKKDQIRPFIFWENLRRAEFAFCFYLNFSRVTNKRRLSGFRFFESSVVDNSNIFFSVISEIQNSTPALTKFYKLKHFVPTESWVDSDLFQVIKLWKKTSLINVWHVVNSNPSVFLWSPNTC